MHRLSASALLAAAALSTGLSAFAETDSLIVELDELAVVAAADTAANLRATRAGTLSLAPGEAVRSAAMLTRPEMDAFAVRRVEDLVPLVPGISVPARFGVATVPNLRGDVAETFINGQRRSGNLFGFRPSYHSMEAIEIVRGPGNVVLGPGSKTGGLINFIPLAAAETTRPTGELSLRLGTWVPSGGGSYRDAEIGLRQRGEIGPAWSWQFAYAGQWNETFYHRNDGRDDFQELFLSLLWNPLPSRKVEMFFQYQWSAAPQTLGVNRPDNDLLRRNLYFTGEPDPTFVPPDDLGIFTPGVVDPGLLVPGPEDRTRIDRRDILLSQDDYANANAFYAQTIWTEELASGDRLINRTLVDHAHRRKRNGFLYLERATQWTFENRTEWLWQPDAGDGWSAVSGATIRYEERLGFTNYWNEFAYAFDITAGREFDTLARFPAFIAPGAVDGPDGQPYYSPQSPFATPETSDSRLTNLALFVRPEWQITEGLRLVTGVRGDLLRARARNPLPPPGVAPVRARASNETVGFEGALHYQRGPAAHYLAFNLMSAVGGNTVSDGLNLYVEEGIRAEDLDNRSRLWEMGGRYSLGGGDLSAGWTLFRQTRVRRDFFGPSDVESKGVELESAWSPVGARWRIFANAAYVDAHYKNASPAEFGGSSIGNVFAPGTGPEGLGNGLGYIGGFFLNSLPPGNYRFPGHSRWQVSTGLSHRLTNNLTANVWWVWRSEQDGNLRREFTLPAQNEGNLSLTWERAADRFSLDIFNLGNSSNWRHNGDTFFNNQFVARELPRRIQLRYTRHW
ncbi:MAG: hypothetical protein JJT96_03960 [Opitutales bacterium]|nr:hypothetical protein [Opitutales bacterium]